MPMEFSRRTMIALDHIHEGQTIFPVFSAALPQIVYCHNAVLVMDDEGMVFENDTLNSKLSSDESKRTICLFEDVSAWGVYDLGEDVTENGVQLDCKDIQIFFAVDDINNFRVCFEYFWNLHRTRSLKLSAQPGTTHGRKVLKPRSDPSIVPNATTSRSRAGLPCSSSLFLSTPCYIDPSPVSPYPPVLRR